MKVPPGWMTRPVFPVLSWWTARYIADQQRNARSESQPISREHRQALSGFFPASLLQETRVTRATVPAPWFYPMMEAVGIRDFPAMSNIGAITFLDVIVYPDQLPLRTLFHELVHVAQYRVLGLRHFARHYVEGLLRTGCYEEIPLEVQAYALEDRFRSNPDRPFAVIEDVERRLNADLL